MKRQTQGQGTAAPVAAPNTFRTSRPWNDQRPTDLVVCCSDGRYHEHIEEFVDDELEIPQSDMLIVPGGPHVFLPVALFPKWSWAGRKWIDFLTQHHPLRRIVLVSHEGCSWYRHITVAGIQLPNLASRQLSDVQRIHDAVRREFSGVQVVSYFAKPEGGYVTFSKVA